MWKTAPIGTLPNLEGELAALGSRRNEEIPDTSDLQPLSFSHGDEEGYCSGLTFVQVSKARGALTCGRCGLRVPLPGEVKTVGDLRKHLASLK